MTPILGGPRRSWNVLVLGLLLGATAFASPSPASTTLVNAGGDLQAALNAARSGDVILLQAGATFVGNYVLPARPDGDGTVVIRTSATDAALPGERSRVTPDAAPLLPKLQSPNGEPALRTAPRSRGWRVVLVEFLPNPGGGGEIIRVGDGSRAQSDAAIVPQDIVFDRCYVHGDPDGGQKRGIALNGGNTTVQDSWISEIKAVGQDSQALGGWNGPGPLTIVNNHLEAAGEVFMLGGSDPSINGLVTSDVTFAGNHVTRQLSWRGSRWQVKNLLELKNARDVSIQGNLFENNWRAAQGGYAIVFTPRNQDGGAPWATVEDVVFRNNVVRHVAAGVNILGRDNRNPSGTTRGIDISDNLFYDVDGANWQGNGEFLLIGDGPADVHVQHNTILQSGNILSAYGGSASQPTPIRGFVFSSNVVRHNAYGVHGDARGVGNDTLSAYFPGAVFTKNVIAGGSSSQYPDGNEFPSPSSFDRLFASLPSGDYHLVGDGSKDAQGRLPGADIDRVSRALRAAQAGEFPELARIRRDRDPRGPATKR